MRRARWSATVSDVARRKLKVATTSLAGCFGCHMFFLRYVFTAASAAVFFSPAHAVETAEQQFAAIAQLPAADINAKVGHVVEIDVTPGDGLTIETHGERAKVLYRMAFNQIAEGWSWRPLADPAVDDYYQYKFLPLQSLQVDRGEYAGEDKVGTPQRMKVIWRYDYFLAFENLYAFYPRAVDDDAGFSADVPAEVSGRSSAVNRRARPRARSLPPSSPRAETAARRPL